MNNHSLKRRFLTLQVFLIAIALAITGYGLILLFERHVERRISLELDTYLTQIAARIGFDSSSMPHLSSKIADPRFENIFSGLYWQITNESAQQTARSRSLWDHQLVLPHEVSELGKIDVHTIKGPRSSTLLVHERRLIFSSLQGEQTVRLSVALDLVELESAVAEFATEVSIALGGLGLFLLLAGWLQVTIGLRPLAFVRDSIASVRNGRSTRVVSDLPDEVSPLAQEVNNLLAAQEVTIQRAKNRADNLAHGFKTPLTALVSDIKRLRDKGENSIADDIEAVSIVFQRQIERELTSSRIRDSKTMRETEVLPVVEKVISTLQRTPDGEKINFHLSCDRGIDVFMDKDDLNEVLGNLLENAVKHALDAISINIQPIEREVVFEIQDNGKGISNTLIKLAQKRGVRLDQSIGGTGLGLAIVNDILEIYGENLDLGTSSLGGLKASFQLPRAGCPPGTFR